MSRLSALNEVSVKLGGTGEHTNELSAWQSIQNALGSIVGIINGITSGTFSTYKTALQHYVIQQGGTGEGEILDLLNELAGLLGVPDVPSGVTEWVGELTAGMADIGEGNFEYGYDSFSSSGNVVPSPIQVLGSPECKVILWNSSDAKLIVWGFNPAPITAANEIEINGTTYVLDENGTYAMETSPFVDGVVYQIKLR